MSIQNLTILLFCCLSIFSVCSYDMTAAEIKQIVDAHNTIRTKYGVTVQMAWDTSIAAGAKAYSDQCIWGHSGAADLGENIGYKGFSNPNRFPYTSVTNTVDDWNGEETSWTCSNNRCSGTCGHFTQNVWKATTKIGCGLSACTFSGYKSQYLVCRYSPAGNYNNQHPLNAPSSSPWCLGMAPPPPVVPTPVKAPTPVQNTPPVKAPTPVQNVPPVAPTASFSKCQVTCSNVFTICLEAPQFMSDKVYCKCSSSSNMMWPVTNAGTSDCTYWPAGVPLPLPYDKCTTKCGKSSSMYCKGKPERFSDGGTYCPCGDAQGYSWPVENLSSADCQYSASGAVTEVSGSDSGLSGLSAGAWVGVCIAIVALAIVIIIVAIVVILKRRVTEKV